METITQIFLLMVAGPATFVGFIVGAAAWGFRGGRKTATEMLDEVLADYSKRKN